MTKKLKYPFSYKVRDSENSYTTISGTKEGSVTMIKISGSNAGEVYVDCYPEKTVIEWLERGNYELYGQSISDVIVKEQEDATILSLRIETDASELTSALSAATNQAKELEATLTRIKNIFN